MLAGVGGGVRVRVRVRGVGKKDGRSGTIHPAAQPGFGQGCRVPFGLVVHPNFVLGWAGGKGV